MDGRLPNLYLVTDRALCNSRPLEQVVGLAVKGGVGMVQLREKDISTRGFIKLASALKEMLSPVGIPIIINDRIDVALAVGADGVHIGQSDMPYKTARKLMGPDAIIGLSVESMEEVLEAQDFDVDYLGVSPVFATPTKTDTKVEWGLEGIAKIKGISGHPLVAIGGINSANVDQVLGAGADCVAVVSDICSAPDPEKAARELLNAFKKSPGELK